MHTTIEVMRISTARTFVVRLKITHRFPRASILCVGDMWHNTRAFFGVGPKTGALCVLVWSVVMD